MNRILFILAAILLAGCSGGNAGSSSGSGGGDPTTPDNTGGSTSIAAGEYNGNVSFTSVNDSAPVTIDIQDNGNLSVTSNNSGSARGATNGNSFTASGTMGFILSTQTCTGLATVSGTGNGNTLTGSVSVSSATCVESGVSTTISLDGSFTASQ